MNSPHMKEFAEQRIAAGEQILVVDLGACSGMDSTFMGTLAGIAARLSSLDGGALQIADAADRNRRSLEDLGLDFLMEIDPPTALWRGRMDAIRSGVRPPKPVKALVPSAEVLRARHVLEAHQNLTEMNDKNAREFASVVKLLENELGEGKDPAKPGSRE